MAKGFVELNPEEHGDLRVVANCVIGQAATQHMIALKFNEVAPAQTEFPVFLTRPEKEQNEEQTQWSLSAITSLEAKQNLFVTDHKWDAIYVPSAMRTYPMFVIQASGDKKGFTVGINPTSSAFSKTEGEALFDEQGKATEYLSHVTAQLEADIKNEVTSYKFIKRLSELDLIREVTLLVTFADQTSHTLRGLHSVDEKVLHELPDQTILALKEEGFLVPIYALLLSLYQVNALIKRHNLREASKKVVDIKVQFMRDKDAER